MNKYSVMIMDLGNVLIPFDYHIVIGKLEKIETGLGEKFGRLYSENYHVHRTFEKGEMSTDEFLSTMLGWLDKKVKKEEFCKIYSSLFSVNEKMIELLPKLKKNYKLVLLSNTNAIHQKYGWKDYEFIKLFDKLILSHEVGSIKPESEIYKAVENFTQVPVNEHFYTDDIEDYVNAAKQRGWDAVQFVGYEEFIVELRKRGIKL
ncbi:HAD-IA family hydrolase [Bacteroidota bacterium]